jgi:hypothetical protein
MSLRVSTRKNTPTKSKNFFAHQLSNEHGRSTPGTVALLLRILTTREIELMNDAISLFISDSAGAPGVAAVEAREGVAAARLPPSPLLAVVVATVSDVVAPRQPPDEPLLLGRVVIEQPLDGPRVPARESLRER